MNIIKRVQAMFLAVVMILALVPVNSVHAEEYSYVVKDGVFSVKVNNLLASGIGSITSQNSEEIKYVSYAKADSQFSVENPNKETEYGIQLDKDTVFQVRMIATGASLHLTNANVSSFKGDGVSEYSLVFPDKIGFWYISDVDTKSLSDNGGSNGYKTTYTLKHHSPLVVTDIGTAFSGQHVFDTWSYVDLTLPYEVVNIPDSAFADNNKLRSFSVKQRIDTIGKNAFQGCVNLTSVDLSTWVTHNSALNQIPDNCFDGCSSLKTIAIPSEIISIGAKAFNNCTKLDSIVLQRSISSIGKNAFSNCFSLRYLYIGNTRKDWVKENNKYEIVEPDKLVSNSLAEATKPIISEDGTGISCADKVYSTGVFYVLSRVDVSDCSITVDGVEVPMNKVESYLYGYSTFGYSFNIDKLGTYVIKAKDVAGNELSRTIKFEKQVTDRVAPVIEVSNIDKSVSDGTNYKAVNVNVTDVDTEVTDVHVNGISVDSDYGITEDGEYTIEAWDGVGNKATKTIAVDTQAPVISGVSDGDVVKRLKSITTSDNLTGVSSVKVDGVEQERKDVITITTSAKHTIEVVDKSGNKTVLSFTLDSIGPSSDIVRNAYYKSIRPNFNSISGLVSAVAKDKDGNVYELISGETVLTKNGRYTVTLTDILGQTASYNFIIDNTAPAISGVKDDKWYKDTVKLSVEDDNIDKVTVNGVEVSRSYTAKNEGTYTVVAVDKAGNKTITKFYVDMSVPRLSVKDGYATKKAFNLRVTDSRSGVAKVYINNKLQRTKSAYRLTKQGKYSIKVVDKAGNWFTYKVYIDRAKPMITGVRNGKTYSRSVKVYAKDTVSGLKKVVVDGRAIKKATSISKKGKHTIIAYDKAGNKTVAKFTIKK